MSKSTNLLSNFFLYSLSITGMIFYYFPLVIFHLMRLPNNRHKRTIDDSSPATERIFTLRGAFASAFPSFLLFRVIRELFYSLAHTFRACFEKAFSQRAGWCRRVRNLLLLTCFYISFDVIVDSETSERQIVARWRDAIWFFEKIIKLYLKRECVEHFKGHLWLAATSKYWYSYTNCDVVGICFREEAR